MWVYFWALCLIPLIYVFAFVQVPYCFDYCTFVAQFDIREHGISCFCYFFLRLSGLYRIFCFHTNFRIISSSFVENAIGILVGIALNLQIASDRIVLLTILIFPIYECDVSFHLFLSSSMYFICVSYFSKYKSFTTLVRFLLKYFILFDAIVDTEMIFLYQPSH